VCFRTWVALSPNPPHRNKDSVGQKMAESEAPKPKRPNLYNEDGRLIIPSVQSGHLIDDVLVVIAQDVYPERPCIKLTCRALNNYFSPLVVNDLLDEYSKWEQAIYQFGNAIVALAIPGNTLICSSCNHNIRSDNFTSFWDQWPGCEHIPSPVPPMNSQRMFRLIKYILRDWHHAPFACTDSYCMLTEFTHKYSEYYCIGIFKRRPNHVLHMECLLKGIKGQLLGSIPGRSIDIQFEPYETIHASDWSDRKESFRLSIKVIIGYNGDTTEPPTSSTRSSSVVELVGGYKSHQDMINLASFEGIDNILDYVKFYFFHPDVGHIWETHLAGYSKTNESKQACYDGCVLILN
jgi:hypothetical protein